MATTTTFTNRHFALPVVREVVSDRHVSVPPPDARRRSASQRQLVLASLIACPRGRG
jgi:hypothetical protein